MDEQRAWLRARRKRRLRTLAVILSFCVLFTSSPHIWEAVSVFAAEESEGEGRQYISGFAALPEEVREQSVPLGTGLQELSLPDALEAYISAKDAENAGGGVETPGDSVDGDSADKETGDEGRESENGGAVSGENESNGGEQEPGGGSREEEPDGENEPGNGENSEENPGGETEENGSDDTEQNETGNADQAESDDAELKQETYTVTMPEYQAENAGTAEVKTLIGGVTWDSAPAYDADTAGTYIFTAALPEGYTLAEGVSMPEIRVTVGENILLFLERAEALPDLDTVLEDAPGEGEEGYEAWEKCFLEAVSEADSLKKAYDAFSETERSQIPEEIYANLMAWWAYGRVMEESALYADIPAWGGIGYAPVRGNGGSGSAVYALGNNLTLKAGEGDKTKVYYMDSDTPIDLAHLEEDNGWNGAPFSFQGEGDVGNGFDLTNTGVVATITGTYYGYQNKGTTDAGGLGNVFSDMDVVIRIEGGTLSGLLNIYPNKYNPKSVTLYMTGGTWLGGSKVGSAIMAHAAYVSGGCMKGSVARWYNLYLSGSPVIGEEGGGLLMGDRNDNGKFYLDGALSSGAAVYINPQKNFADGTVLAEGSGYTITESDLAYLHLTGDNVAGKELQLKNNQIIITHIHELTYAAEDAVITESCANGCGHSATATLSVKSGADLTYTGSEIKPVTVTYSDNWGGTDADKPDDAAISYSNNINAEDATASLTIAEQTANLTFAVNPRDISDAAVTLDSTTLTYNGAVQTKGVSKVTVTADGKPLTLTAGTDYTISGNQGTDAKSYTMTLTGKGNYTGTKKVDFTIAAKPLTAGMVTVAAGPHYYTGNTVTPAVTVKDGSRPLTAGTDYTVNYRDNINAGTATVTVTGKGNYTGSASQTFAIQYGSLPAGKELADYVTVSPAPTDGWYGAEITLTPKSGCGVGETPSDIGSAGVTVSDETGADETTKTIYIKDGNGNIYQTAFPYKLDKTPPTIVLSHMSVTDGTKGLFNWIIGKKSMIIRIPEADITDALSGIREVSYTAVPDSDTQQTQTMQVKGGSYEISLNAEFSGTIKLTAEDKAGNVTEVSLTAEGGKVIAEDYAPVVTITLPDTPKPNEKGWYNTAVSVKVTVTDDKNADDTGILSGGIAEIKWKDGEKGAEKTVEGLPGTSPVYKKEFAISVSTDGAHTYYVKAIDNAGNESGWQTVTVKCDAERPVFTKDPEASNHTQEGADITFTPSEGGKAYWLVNPETTPGAQDVVEKGAQNNCVKEDMTGGSSNSFTLTGLTPGESHTVYVVLEDAAGNLSEVKAVSFGTLQKAPEISLKGLIIDHEKETIKIPDGIGEVEVYTDPEHPSESRIPSDTDGALSVDPGTTIYIRYPAKTGSETTPASDSVEINIPGRPAAPSQKQVSVTDTTVTVTDPVRGEEYILVPKGSVPAGQEPDWSGAKEKGAFTGLDPNQEYELWVRKKATGNDFASEPSKTEVKTYVTVKEPVITGEGAGEDGNTAFKPAAPDASGTVPFTGTYGEEYTPVIKVGGQEISPETTWDERAGKGTWEYPYPITEDEDEIEITVEFRRRTMTEIVVTPENLKIYADHAANRSAAEAGSMAPLTAWLEEECIPKASYDNKTEGTVQGAVYATTDQLAPKGKDYNYTVFAEGKTTGLTLTVAPVNAAVTAPPEVTQMQKSGGYTQAEVAAWLPEQVTVTYTGTGYTTRTESRPVTWNTAAVGADFGGTLGEKTVSGTVALPDWATGQKDVSISIAFVDKQILTDAQMNLSVSGWTYGAQEGPAPRGSVSVADTNPVIAYLYSADGGVSWTEAERLPKSGSGHTVPGTYQVKMIYTGDGYTGTKTAAFTVEKRTLTVEKGTLEAEDKNYDGTLTAVLKAGGEPTLTGVLTGDTITAGGTLRAEFAEAGPKKNIVVTVTGFELEGGDAGYYIIGNTSVTLRATINKADGTPPSDGKKPGGGDKDKDEDKGADGNNGGENDGSGDGTGNGGEAGISGGSQTPVVSLKNPGNPSGTPAPAETDRSAPEQKKLETGSNPGREPGAQPTRGQVQESEKQGDGKSQNAVVDTENKTGQDTTVTDNGGQTDSGTVRSVTAAADQGRIVVSGERVPTGNVAGMEQASTAMTVGNGAVFVTVVCEDEKYAAGVNDTAAVANAVLSSEQVELVNDGGTIEIRVDVKDISEKVPQQDQEVIENGLVEYQKEVPNLTLGRYIDISMFIKIGESDWDAIASTEEPIEVVIGIPEDMREDSREFYIIRAHEGEHTFMHDLDEEPDTVTISTDMFSSYAIAYAAAGNGNEGGSACGLCHICPTFLGVCCFIWLAAVTVIILLIAVVVLRREKEKKQKE